MKTVPSGRPSSGPGPPTPVVATAKSACSRRATPVAICCAVAALITGPRSTPSRSYLTSAAYATTPPMNQSLAPSIALSPALTLPPVSDSADAAVRLVSASRPRRSASARRSSVRRRRRRVSFVDCLTSGRSCPEDAARSKLPGLREDGRHEVRLAVRARVRPGRGLHGRRLHRRPAPQRRERGRGQPAPVGLRRGGRGVPRARPDRVRRRRPARAGRRCWTPCTRAWRRSSGPAPTCCR